jgi:hypothetical protein
MEVQVKIHIRDYEEVQGDPPASDPPDSLLYRFHFAEKRRARRWELTKVISAWILCGVAIAAVCLAALR